MPVPSEKLDALAQADRTLRLDRALGDAETLGDLALREAVDFSQRDDLSAAIRERLNGLEQQPEILGARDRFTDLCILVYNTRDVELGGLISAFAHSPAEAVEREVAGGDKEEGSCAGDRAGGVRAKQPRVRLLHEIVEIGVAGKAPAKVGAKIGLVRLDLFHEPAGMFGPG